MCSVWKLVRETVACLSLALVAGVAFVVLIHLDDVYLHWLGIGTCLAVVVICIGLMVLIQACFGARKKSYIALRAGSALTLLVLVGIYLDRAPESTLHVPIRMLQGEGMWTCRIGEAHVDIGERHICYDVYMECARPDEKAWPRGKLLLVSRNPESLRSNEFLLRNMVLSPDELFSASVKMMHLPLLPTATVCGWVVSMGPHYTKCQMFGEVKTSVSSGVRRYDCVFDPSLAMQNRFVCVIEDGLFGRSVRVEGSN